MKNRRGYTLIELVLVLMLLILVASMVFLLSATGSQTYLRLTAKQAQAADLRTGLSYLDVQIRQHDEQGALSITPGPFDSSPALAIKRIINDKTYTTWIYLRDGYLCELFVAEETVIMPDMGSRIVAMDGFAMEPLADGAIKITLSRQAKDQAEIVGSRIICLKAGGVES